MLCIWWDQKDVLYYELLKQGETVNGEPYRTQLIRLKRAIAEKRLEYATKHKVIIFHHDNARPHVAIPVKNYLENSGLEFCLPHPPYSPDLAPSDYPDNNRARHDARTPCGSHLQTRVQQSRAHSSKDVRGISVRRICVAVCDHSCRHASLSNETHIKLRYIKFNNR